MADILDFAPALLFADVLTTTDVIGKPPKSELNILPMPCAFNSTLVSVYLFWGSILSAASIHNKVSMEATIAMVNPTIQTFELVNPDKFGVVKIFLNSLKLLGIGKLTKCSFPMANELPVLIKNSFKTTPKITATSAPGINFNFFRNGNLSHNIRINKDIIVIIIAPNCT